MALADEVERLRVRVATELDEAFNYFQETISAWLVVQRTLELGWVYSIGIEATGRVIPHDEILSRANQHISGPLIETNFQQFVTIFEGFVLDFLRLWLFAYPRGLSDRKVDIQVILDSPDRDAILREVINREIVEITYKRPAEWFAFLESRVRLGCPNADEIAEFSEAKATRDLLAHNRGVVNNTYLQKAGDRARFAEDERIEIVEPYHRRIWNLCRKLVNDIATAAIDRIR